MVNPRVAGKDYDAHGERTARWSRRTVDEYLRRARCFADEYDRYELADGVRVSVVNPASRPHLT